MSAARENSSPCGLALGARWCGAGAAAAALSSPAARAWTENTGALPLLEALAVVAALPKRPPPPAPPAPLALAAVGIFDDVTPRSALPPPPCASPPSGAALDALSHAGVPPKSDFLRL